MTGRSIFGGKDKEEFYRYHENPATSVTGQSIFGGKNKDKEEYYRYHENPKTSMTGRSFFGGKEKEREEYYRYHDNPETSVTGRSIFGGKEKKQEESKVKERHDIDRRVDGPRVVFNWHAVPFTLESWRRRCLFISEYV